MLTVVAVAVEMAVAVAMAVEMAVELAVAVEMAVAVAMELTSLTCLIFENDVANALSCLVEQILNLLGFSIVEVGAV